MSKPKYVQGQQLTHMLDFVLSDTMWFKWRGKTKHRAFFESWSYRTLDREIKAGIIYTAVIPEPPKPTEEYEVEYIERQYASDYCISCGEIPYGGCIGCPHYRTIIEKTISPKHEI